jgi:protein-disulfide isomerase
MPPVPTPKAAKAGRNRSLLIAIAIAGIVAVALIAGSIVLSRDSGKDAADTSTATTSSTPAPVALVAGIPQKGTVLGNPDANVRMLQFEDIQCPICKTYNDDALPAIVEEYVRPGKLKIDFRGLAFLGPDSVKALRISLAAGFQNKLWEVVGLFYENQGAENSGWVTDTLVDEILAQVPGLDAEKVKADALTSAVTSQVVATQAQSEKLKVPGTPAFYIGIGAEPVYKIEPRSFSPSEFRPALDDALSQ